MAFLQLVNKLKLRFISCQLFKLQKRRYCGFIFFEWCLEMLELTGYLAVLRGKSGYCLVPTFMSVPGIFLIKKELIIKSHITKLVELYKTQPSGNSE
ncbi:hypothetical protein BZG20_04170 [Salinivibrio sp. IB868]|nr:hypothetical protein BZG20_04170 [Salinivibrio sp. IB868]OOE75459.1 hypothetical protein BZG22_06490 [Salinivibrio sp. IB870]